jgi:hypothetical protein
MNHRTLVMNTLTDEMIIEWLRRKGYILTSMACTVCNNREITL